MIYLVSNIQSLFNSDKYEKCTLTEAIYKLREFSILQCDTETMGLDCHTKSLLTIQLGNKQVQYVLDWNSLNKEDRQLLKEFMEGPVKLIFHNAQFDLTFLYKQNIWPQNILDTMLIEQLLYLGYPATITKKEWDELDLTEDLPMYEYVESKDPKKEGSYKLSYALNKVAFRRLGIDIDKSVRGKIITQGLTEEVIVYAANDVVWLEDIYNSQMEDVRKEHLEKAVMLECAFVKCLAYIKFCGVKLDVEKWKAKMAKDQASLNSAIKKLNDWVVAWEENHLVDFQGQRVCLAFADPQANTADRLIANGFAYYPARNKDNLLCYLKPCSERFTKVDYQGDLFEGFNTDPQCIINWSSQPQVIKLFKLLGINTKTFDKKTKTEKDSVEANVLKPQKHLFPIIPLFLEYQKFAKVVSTYGQNWLDAINPATKRLHLEFHSIGTDTSRVSSGGGEYSLNMQNLPHDPETRACFISEPGNKWISIDYQSQESRLIASVSKDPAMIELFQNGCGDVHSLVAKMSYPEVIPRDFPIEEINKEYHSYRQDAKGIEFAINYGGDANTIATNKGIPLTEAKQIYDNFMKGFPGVKIYQDYCRKNVMEVLYVLMNNVFGHRAHIYDAAWLKRMQERFDPEFWEYYRELKASDPMSQTVRDVRRYFRRKSALEKEAINYRIQNRGACCFKLSAIYYFNHIIKNNLQNIVLMCVPAHDEFNNEAPADLAEQEGKQIEDCMVRGGEPFCKNVYLGADCTIGDHWIH